MVTQTRTRANSSTAPRTRRTAEANPEGVKPSTAKKKKPQLVTQSLPVKYRPRSLQDYYGQDKVVTAITGGLSRGRLSSSLMFVGLSGSGKTTLARILARIINCSDLQEGFIPCEECQNCKLPISDHPDVHEINFAEQRGIDDVRALLQQCKNMPMFGNKRIFILDEAHAMTSAAQGALLKPTEEPPEHTMWLICTTDPQKFSATLSNRFTKLSLQPIASDLIAKRLRILSKREGHDCRDNEDLKKAIELIADYSNGQMRNAIEMLDSALNVISTGQDLTDERVIRKHVMSDDANVEESAANLLAAILQSDTLATCKVIRAAGSANVRTLVSKCRWLVDHLIETKVGYPKFTPQSARVFATLKIKWTVENLVQTQFVLSMAEDKMNTLNIEDRVVLESFLYQKSKF